MAEISNKTRILSAAREAGVVGAGGAGFPTHAKLEGSAGIVLVNGAECEPLLRVDQLLAEAFPEKALIGLLAAMDAVGAEKGIYGLKEKYHAAEAALKKAIDNTGVGDRVSIGTLPDIYPAGDEHVLTYELTGRVIPQGALPLAVGTMVVNTETLCNLADSLSGIPVTTTWLTLGGLVKHPCTINVPVGMSMSDVIEALGGPSVPGCALIEGGPMMGRLVDSWDEPVTKQTKGLLLLPPDSMVVDEKRRPLGHIIKRTAGACDQCRNCTDLCPRYLLGHDLNPHLILRAVNNGLPLDGLITQASLCSECGLCSLAACPVNLHPRRINSELKREFRKQGYAAKMPSDSISGPRRERSGRMLPTKRLIRLLGLDVYDVPAPLGYDGVMIPGKVSIPLKQHAGAAALPVVRVGDRVAKGQLLAEANGRISARIHSSIGGIVEHIGDSIVICGE